MNLFSWWHRTRRPNNKHLEADLREELQFHLKQESQQLGVDLGLSEQDALRAAHRNLGNVTRIVEDTRAVWISTFLEQLLQDIRYALRTMRGNALTTLLAITSLALGIGANTAIYSFMDAILVRALPVQDPASLVVVNWLATKPGRMELMRSMDGSAFRDEAGLTSGVFPYPAYELLRKISTNEFSHVFAHRPGRTLHLTVNGAAHIVKAEFVSGNFFQSLAIQPAFGRLLQEHDDQFSAAPVIAVSYAFAERHFATAPHTAAGQTILVNNVPFTITGVVPPGFHGVNPSTVPDIYLPLTTQAVLDPVQPPSVVQGQFRDAHYYWLEIMARLRPGVTREQAQARLGPQVAAWFESTSQKAEERANLPSLYLRDGARGLDTLRRQFSKPLYVLLTLVGLILALACANIANLLLARATARRKEFTLRLSLGAGRMRLVRQLLTESLVLGLTGGILGVAVALWGMRFLTMLLANGDPNFTLRAELNWNVLAVATLLSLLTGVLFGLAPALQSAKAKEAGVQPALKEHRRPTSRLSDFLIAGQIAISLLMLVAAGLFVRTLSNLQSIDVGFQTSNLLIFELNVRQAGYDTASAMNFYRDLRNRLTAVPGVRNATFSNRSLVRAGFSLGSRIPGNTAPWYPKNRMLMVGPDYFTTMSIPLLAGREILESDRAPGTIVVNEEFVKRNFDGKNPIGRHILVGRGPLETDMEIVGICKDIQYGGLKGTPPPVAFLSTHTKYQPDRAVFEVRTVASDPMQSANTIRELVRGIDPRVPVTDMKSQSTDIEQTVTQEMVFARLCTGFAILGLLIACVGLYGTVAYNVARRTAEIGIRMALGASQGSVLAMVLRRVILLTGVGIAIGLPIALGTSRFVESFLFGMKPNDPASIAVAIGILALAIVAASYLPARRAAKIDPMTALRYE
jgi:predicted permease